MLHPLAIKFSRLRCRTYSESDAGRILTVRQQFANSFISLLACPQGNIGQLISSALVVGSNKDEIADAEGVYVKGGRDTVDVTEESERKLCGRNAT